MVNLLEKTLGSTHSPYLNNHNSKSCMFPKCTTESTPAFNSSVESTLKYHSTVDDIGRKFNTLFPEDIYFQGEFIFVKNFATNEKDRRYRYTDVDK